MPHLRKRFIFNHFEKLRSFWPITGVLGLRQVGKSTFLRDLAGLQHMVTLDDDDIRTEAEASVKVFLAKLKPPCVIDEVQKVPKVLDGLKSWVDKKRIPGQWVVTGSVFFQDLSVVRDSLTGRIGLVRMHPMTLAEIKQKQFRPILSVDQLLTQKWAEGTDTRFDVSTVASQLSGGGLPVPLFMRDQKNRHLYFTSWLDTLLVRDAAKVFGRSYDFEIASRILKDLGKILSTGQHPQLTDFKTEQRKLQKYLKAFETLFLLRRFSVVDEGVGKDFWLPTDSGLAHFLMNYAAGPEANLSLARVFVLNELIANLEYQGAPQALQYYKSQHGSVIDFVWQGVPFKFIAENIASSRMGWIEKPLLGAMKTLRADRGVIIAPVDQGSIEQKGISILPWGCFS